MEFESFVLAASVRDLSAATDAVPHADAVEFRMDLASDPLAQLRAYDGDLPVVATNRTTEEGGDASPGRDRLALLEDAVDISGVEAVDVELATLDGGGTAVLEAAADAGVATVVSVHDFEGTPARERITTLLERASDRGTVGKLAVTADDRGDVLRLLSVTHELSRSARVATMAMGEAGRHSRAVAPLYGSVLGYAPVGTGAATAPGQYDLATLSELVATLE